MHTSDEERQDPEPVDDADDEVSQSSDGDNSSEYDNSDDEDESDSDQEGSDDGCCKVDSLATDSRTAVHKISLCEAP